MLEGMNFGTSANKVKQAKKERLKAEEPKKFNFKTTKRAEGTPDLRNETAQYLNKLPKDRAVDLWKVYFIKKHHNEKQAKNYKEICDYLIQRYGINIPKRSNK